MPSVPPTAAAPERRPAPLLHRAALLLPLAGLLAIGGCLRRVDAPLPPTAGEAHVLSWESAGSFGGDAVRQVDSSDPWQVRFRPGGFVEIAGLCVHHDQVWVCDLGVSRLQVFGLDGGFQRQYGAGVPIEGTLLSAAELYIEERDYDRSAEPRVPRWEDGPGRPWVADQVNLFKAADVVVVEDGYIIADQARTGAQARPLRRDEVALIRWDGTRQEFDGDVIWPAYLANQDRLLAIAQSPGNALCLAELGEESWPYQALGTNVNFLGVMELLVEQQVTANYELAYGMVTEASLEPRGFNGLGGVAIAYDKAVVCDTGNQLLKVFDARRSDPLKWGALIRFISARKRDGGVRFVAPRAVAIDGAGLSYVLDVNPLRVEVAVLDQHFDRVGSFGADELATPYDIAVTPDGRHCFITDRHENRVLHYVRGE